MQHGVLPSIGIAMAMTGSAIERRFDEAPTMPVILERKCGAGCTGQRGMEVPFANIAGRGWQTPTVPLSCLSGADLRQVTTPFAITTTGRMRAILSSVALITAKDSLCS